MLALLMFCRCNKSLFPMLREQLRGLLPTGTGPLPAESDDVGPPLLKMYFTAPVISELSDTELLAPLASDPPAPQSFSEWINAQDDSEDERGKYL
jgi:hypothetical protein